MTTKQFETCIVDERSSSIDDFDSRWYIGKIINKDLDEENCYIHPNIVSGKTHENISIASEQGYFMV